MVVRVGGTKLSWSLMAIEYVVGEIARVLLNHKYTPSIRTDAQLSFSVLYSSKYRIHAPNLPFPLTMGYLPNSYIATMQMVLCKIPHDALGLLLCIYVTHKA